MGRRKHAELDEWDDLSLGEKAARLFEEEMRLKAITIVAGIAMVLLVGYQLIAFRDVSGRLMRLEKSVAMKTDLEKVAQAAAAAQAQGKQALALASARPAAPAVVAQRPAAGKHAAKRARAKVVARR